jgi:hypothetical protein
MYLEAGRHYRQVAATWPLFVLKTSYPSVPILAARFESGTSESNVTVGMPASTLHQRFIEKGSHQSFGLHGLLTAIPSMFRDMNSRTIFALAALEVFGILTTEDW